MTVQSRFRALCHCCGLRFVWAGTLWDMPPCPRCGQTMPDEEKHLGQAQLEAAARQNAASRLRRIRIAS